jgi:hypothetical protein
MFNSLGLIEVKVKITKRSVNRYFMEIYNRWKIHEQYNSVGMVYWVSS